MEAVNYSLADGKRVHIGGTLFVVSNRKWEKKDRAIFYKLMQLADELQWTSDRQQLLEHVVSYQMMDAFEVSLAEN